MDLLGEGNGGIIVSELAGGRAVGAGESNAVVDVEDAVGTAGRVDVAGGGDGVSLGVDLAIGPDAATGDGGLGGGGVAGRLAEVVGRVESASDTGVELGVAVVRAVDDGELEATGVLEVQVELAVLGLVGRVEAGSDVSLELIEAEGDDLANGKSARMSKGSRTRKLRQDPDPRCGSDAKCLPSCRGRCWSRRNPGGSRYQRSWR